MHDKIDTVADGPTASRRRYWFTRHDPQPKELVGVQPAARHIWMKEGNQAYGSNIAPGDRVVIYEVGKSDQYTKEGPDGVALTFSSAKGRTGVVSLGEVTSPLQPNGDTTPEVYADGKERWWRWKAIDRPPQ